MKYNDNFNFGAVIKPGPNVFDPVKELQPASFHEIILKELESLNQMLVATNSISREKLDLVLQPGVLTNEHKESERNSVPDVNSDMPKLFQAYKEKIVEIRNKIQELNGTLLRVRL